MVRGRLARHELGPLAPVAEQLEWLRFALTRLAHLKRGAPQRTAMLDGARASAQALDHQLLGQLAQRLGDRELVIVPTGALHDLPWSILPSLRGRPLVVVAVGGDVVGAAEAAPARRRTRSCSWPGHGCATRLPRSKRSANCIRDPKALTGRAATAAAVLRALDGATVAHLACHGQFRSDSPLFSSLELADGPLNAYELQRLRRAPELIVLSACDLAVSDTHPGDELLGFAAALLDMGTRTIIASVVPVRDASAKRLMLGLHRQSDRGRHTGRRPGRAQAALSDAPVGPNGFVCLGSG